MKTLLTKYELVLYGFDKPITLCTGTTNQIIQWRERENLKTDDEIRKAYGTRFYTVLYEVNR